MRRPVRAIRGCFVVDVFVLQAVGARAALRGARQELPVPHGARRAGARPGHVQLQGADWSRHARGLRAPERPRLRVAGRGLRPKGRPPERALRGRAARGRGQHKCCGLLAQPCGRPRARQGVGAAREHQGRLTRGGRDRPRHASLRTEAAHEAHADRRAAAGAAAGPQQAEPQQARPRPERPLQAAGRQRLQSRWPLQRRHRHAARPALRPPAVVARA